MRLLLLFLSLIFLSACIANEGEVQSSDLITLKINQQTISVEYADELHERTLGLMYREELCEDCGMLFKFEEVRQVSMWMKNTNIPLDVAYISETGVITDIKPLKPHDLTSVPSSTPVLFALEMNRGWFANYGIQVGDFVELPGHVK